MGFCCCCEVKHQIVILRIIRDFSWLETLLWSWMEAWKMWNARQDCSWVLGTLPSFPQLAGAPSPEHTMVGRELQVCGQNSSPRSHGSRIPILPPTTCKNVSRGLDWALGKWLWQRSPRNEIAERKSCSLDMVRMIQIGGQMRLWLPASLQQLWLSQRCEWPGV